MTGALVCGASANPFSWKALRGSMGSVLRLPIAAGLTTHQAFTLMRKSGVRTIAAVPRGGQDPDAVELARQASVCSLGGEGPGLHRRGRSRSATRGSRFRWPPWRRISQRRRGRCDSRLRRTASARMSSLFDDEDDDRRGGSSDPPSRPQPRNAAGRTHAPAHARRDRRAGRHPRAGQTAARGDRARPAAIDHPLGTSRHRQDDARARHRRGDARALRPVQRRARGHQGDQGGHGRGPGSAPAHGPADDRLRRRDPSLQQGAAGRLPSPRRGRRHRPDRRDDGESVVRGERGAAVALEGVRAEGAAQRRPSRASCGAR